MGKIKRIVSVLILIVLLFPCLIVNAAGAMSDFYYNGIPDGKYSVTKGFWERIIESLDDIFEYLIGMMTMANRMFFVGWTAIFDNLITSTVKMASGEKNIETISTTSADIESGENITIEKIVFNQISIFDVNFFNFRDQQEAEEAEATE